MSRQGLRALVKGASSLPKFKNQRTAGRRLLSQRDELLRDLSLAARTSEEFEALFTPESLKTLERWYFDLLERNRFKAARITRQRLERAMPMYLGETIVRNNPEFAWCVVEHVMESGRYEIGVRREGFAWMLNPMNDLARRPNNKLHQSIWRQYEQYCGRKELTMTRRDITLAWATGLGLPMAGCLPTLGDYEVVRSDREVSSRILCLYATAATHFGCQPQLATSWLSGLGLIDALTPAEAAYIAGPDRPLTIAIECIEGAWSLLWASGVRDDLAPEIPVCPDDLIQSMPSMLTEGEGESFLGRCSLRPPKELLDVLDKAYYLHWSLVESALRGQPLPGVTDLERAYARRRALEWLFSEEDWDDVPMDT